MRGHLVALRNGRACVMAVCACVLSSSLWHDSRARAKSREQACSNIDAVGRVLKSQFGEASTVS